MDAFIIALIALLLAAGSLAYAIHSSRHIRQLERDQQRTRLLNRMTECTVIINQIMEDMGRYEDYGRKAFGDNPQDIPDLTETLQKVENLHASFSDYNQETTLEQLAQATTQIEKVLALMKNVAAKSPRLHSGSA